MGNIGPARQRYEVLPVEPLRTCDFDLDDAPLRTRDADEAVLGSSADAHAGDADRSGDEQHPA